MQWKEGIDSLHCFMEVRKARAQVYITKLIAEFPSDIIDNSNNNKKKNEIPRRKVN